MPLSRTQISALPAVRRASRARCWPPSPVYLAALCSRLPTTCASRTGSPRTVRCGVDRARPPGAASSVRAAAARFPTAAAMIVRDVHALGHQHDLAARDARHVEQVVDQPDHVLELPLDDAARPDDLRILRLALHEHVRGIAQRRQRIAQLVRQHRQELVALDHRLLEHVLGARALADLGLERLVGARQFVVGALQVAVELLELARLLRLQREVGVGELPVGLGQLLVDAPAARGAWRSSSTSTATLLRRISGITGMYT